LRNNWFRIHIPRENLLTDSKEFARMYPSSLIGNVEDVNVELVYIGTQYSLK